MMAAIAQLHPAAQVALFIAIAAVICTAIWKGID